MIVTERSRLVNAFKDIQALLDNDISINLDYEPVRAYKTKKQLGFIFGLIADGIKSNFEEAGYKISVNDIKNILYNDCSEFSDFYSPKGAYYAFSKTLSQMDRKEVAKFIDNCLNWCDENGITLLPEAYYCWINNLSEFYINEVSQLKFQEKDDEYLRHVRKQHCLICGKLGCEAHHLKSGDTGIGAKSPDWMAVSLCAECHRNYQGSNSHMTTEKLIELTPYINWGLGVKTISKLIYEHWRR
jgi:hypothetical protein